MLGDSLENAQGLHGRFLRNPQPQRKVKFQKLLIRFFQDSFRILSGFSGIHAAKTPCVTHTHTSQANFISNYKSHDRRGIIANMQMNHGESNVQLTQQMATVDSLQR